jgi:hypothetical protein
MAIDSRIRRRRHESRDLIGRQAGMDGDSFIRDFGKKEKGPNDDAIFSSAE